MCPTPRNSLCLKDNLNTASKRSRATAQHEAVAINEVALAMRPSIGAHQCGKGVLKRSAENVDWAVIETVATRPTNFGVRQLAPSGRARSSRSLRLLVRPFRHWIGSCQCRAIGALVSALKIVGQCSMAIQKRRRAGLLSGRFNLLGDSQCDRFTRSSPRSFAGLLTSDSQGQHGGDAPLYVPGVQSVQPHLPEAIPTTTW